MLKRIASCSFLVFISFITLVSLANAQPNPNYYLARNYPVGGTAYRYVNGQLVPYPNALVYVSIESSLNHSYYGKRVIETRTALVRADANGKIKAPDFPCYENTGYWDWNPNYIIKHIGVEEPNLVVSATNTTSAGSYNCTPSWNFTNTLQPTFYFNNPPAKDRANFGPSCGVGEPVNITNGNMWLEQNDYSLPGIGEFINLNRFYNSQLQEQGLFGVGWTTDYDAKIVDGSQILTVKTGNGRAYYFYLVSGIYQPMIQGFHGSVVKNTDNTYTLTFKDGRIHQFGTNKKLLWQKDRNGNQTTLSYDGGGNLTAITDPFGRSLSVAMSSGKITQISDSLGVVATYVYNGNSTLQSVTYADGSKYQFDYTTINSQPFLTTVRDALNNILETHQYDAQGRATTSEKQGGVERYTIDYTHSDDTATPPYTLVTDALNRQSKFTFTKNYGANRINKIEGNCGCGGNSQTVDYVYDDYLNLIQQKDALGRTINYTFDKKGNPLTITDPVGTESFTYNNFGQVLTRTDKMGGVWTNVYDGQGKLLTVTNPLNATTTVAYTPAGQIATVTDPLNRVTTFYYDAGGRLTQTVDANNKTTTYSFDARSRLTSVTNAIGQVTNIEYDLADRVKKVIHPDAKFIINNYDLAGRKISSVDERGFTTNYTYDGAYRLTTVTDALNHTTTLSYDLMSNLLTQTDALGNVTSYQYDAFDRPLKVIYPLAQVGVTPLEENFEYDPVGNLKKRIDTAGRQTLYDYDALNRLIKTTDADLKITLYEYNARNQMTKVIDAIGQQYLFNYNALGWVLSQSRAGNTMSFSYDAVGNKISRTDYKNVTTNYVYDNLNRLTSINYPQSAENISYVYDDLSRLVSATNYAGTITNTFDVRNRLASTTDVHAKVVAYSYDEASNRTQLKLDGVTQASYLYDQVNRLTQITDDASQTYNFGYDNINRLISKTLPNGITTSYVYDGMSRLRQMKDEKVGSVLYDRQYSYNTANNISQIAEPNQQRNFSYDLVDRLLATTYANPTQTNETYNYDAVGNRTNSFLSANYTYQPFNRLTGTSSASFVYDSNGNMVSKTDVSGTTQYIWDFENRLRQVIKPDSTTVNYKYDAYGRRSERYIGANFTKFTYDGQDVILDINSDGSFVKYLNGQGIDNKIRQTVSGQAQYFIQDHLGSTNALTDSSGNILSSTAYDSFGNTTASLGTRYQYTGREKDDVTGLIYYRARWYDSNLGRFISEDPIGLNGGINQFGYVRNNPIIFSDPTGLLDPIVFQDPRMYDSENPEEDLDNIQIGLAGLGLIPIIGEPFDAIDGVVCLFRGDYTGAALSGAAMIPFGGMAASGTKLLKGINHANDSSRTLKAADNVPNPYGILGKPSTRQHIDDVATELERRGWTIQGGGNRGLKEEYLKGVGPGRKGSSLVDITATKNGKTLRINTVDTYADGVTPTKREATNAARIRKQRPGDHLVLIPKPKK